MAAELCILHLEDDPRDIELMMASLRQAGIHCEVVRVASRDQFVEKLANRTAWGRPRPASKVRVWLAEPISTKSAKPAKRRSHS